MDSGLLFVRLGAGTSGSSSRLGTIWGDNPQSFHRGF